jgi:hypothetical protein
VGLPFDALLLGHATNAWAARASANDVSALSTLGGVVWTLDSAADVLPPRMARAY